MDKKTRILAVLPGMWARGGEISTLNLLMGLREAGYEQLYFHAALRQNLPVDMEMYLRPRLQKVCQDVSWGIHGTTPELGVMLAHTMTTLHPNIVVYSWDKSIPYYAYAQNAKSVLVVHGIADNDFAAYNPAYTDAVVCVSRYAAKMAKSHGIPEHKLFTIPNGVPPAVGRTRRKRWKIPYDAWVWCFVGGLNRLKRPNLLIAALAERASAWEDEYAVFAGFIDGGMRLDEYATALGVRDRCKFLGHVGQIGDVYKSSDCHVITSERESMPLTMLEAMSAGVPTVANDVGGISEVIKAGLGVLTDAHIPDELDSALGLMRCLSVDEELKTKITQEWKTGYSHTVMTDAYLRLFEHLLAQGG